MSGLKIIKASAGSGKTHTLTQEYINLLIPQDDSTPLDRDAYKHILAVTFTNKATDEMKNRVIEYLKELSEKPGIKGRRAAKVLTSILHDYSSFAVSTIDRFFQSTMRAFAREIGHFASYKVELDTDAVMKQCVDLMMASLEDASNKELLDWLMEYSFSLIENGERWDVTSQLESMVRLFMTEDFKIQSKGLDRPLGDKAAIASLKSELDVMIRDIPAKLIDIGKRGCAILDRYSLDPADFAGGSRSSAFRFVKWAEGDMAPVTDTMRSWLEGADKWYAKKTPPAKRALIEAACDDGLMVLLREAVSFFENEMKLYGTAKMILHNIYLVGIFSDIHSIMEKYLKDNNMVLLGETSDVLNRIIDGNDTPFVYEKIGTRYDHYMLDEFQDTSRLQWLNFLPLIRESLANGESDLIVGDIKQSIYRWRGSDLTLLSDELHNSFDASLIEESPLDCNWRSCSEIIEFNNSFFPMAGTMISSEEPEVGRRITEFYSDSVQKLARKDSHGCVKVSFVPRSDDDNLSWKERVLERLDELMEETAGYYELSDVAFLVRTNFEGALVAQKLLSSGYDVVTDDSLVLSSSRTLQKVIALLKMDLAPADELNNLMLDSLFEGEIPVEILSEGADLSLYERCEEMLRHLPGGVPQSETPYVMAFLDSVVTYTDKFGSNPAGFIDWWEECGGKKSISAPDNPNAVRIMTIHKSKGLKFECVVIPFLECPFKPSPLKPLYLWCKPDSPPFNKIGLVPLRYSSGLSDTIFKEQYQKEKLMQYVDNVNIAYVAMTRAVSQMTIFAPEPKIDRKGLYKPNAISDLLFTHLHDSLDDNKSYSIGKMSRHRSDAKSSATGEQLSYTSVPVGTRLRLSLKGEDFYNRRLGIVNHNILSCIETYDDVERAVSRFVHSGDVPRTEAEQRVQLMKELISSVSSRHWFDGTYDSLNEAAILLDDGSNFRPDRILLERGKPVGSGEAIVVDYKFGSRRDEYRFQVRNYMELLRRMGYSPVKGALWYCNDNMIEDET